MAEVQCFDGDGVKHPTLSGTVVTSRVDVVRTYQDQGKVKLKLFGDMADIKARLREVAHGADWFQIVTIEHGQTHVTSFYELRIDSIQETYDGVLCRIFYERSDPRIKTYVQPRHRDKKYNWSITNP